MSKKITWPSKLALFLWVTALFLPAMNSNGLKILLSLPAYITASILFNPLMVLALPPLVAAPLYFFLLRKTEKSKLFLFQVIVGLSLLLDLPLAMTMGPAVLVGYFSALITFIDTLFVVNENGKITLDPLQYLGEVSRGRLKKVWLGAIAVLAFSLLRHLYSALTWDSTLLNELANGKKALTIDKPLLRDFLRSKQADADLIKKIVCDTRSAKRINFAGLARDPQLLDLTAIKNCLLDRDSSLFAFNELPFEFRNEDIIKSIRTGTPFATFKIIKSITKEDPNSFVIAFVSAINEATIQQKRAFMKGLIAEANSSRYVAHLKREDFFEFNRLFSKWSTEADRKAICGSLRSSPMWHDGAKGKIDLLAQRKSERKVPHSKSSREEILRFIKASIEKESQIPCHANDKFELKVDQQLGEFFWANSDKTISTGRSPAELSYQNVNYTCIPCLPCGCE